MQRNDRELDDSEQSGRTASQHSQRSELTSSSGARGSGFGLFILPPDDNNSQAVTRKVEEEVPCPSCGSSRRVVEYRLPLFAGLGERRLRALQRCSSCEVTERARDEARAVRELRDRLIKTSGIDPEAYPMSLQQAHWPALQEDPMNDGALERVRAWVHGEFSLYLSGPPGSGKTVLALAAAMDCLRTARPQAVLYVRDQDFIQLARARWRDDSVELALQRLARAQALVYDDLGRHRLTDYVREAL